MGHKVSVMAAVVAVTSSPAQVDCFVTPSSSKPNFGIVDMSELFSKIKVPSMPSMERKEPNKQKNNLEILPSRKSAEKRKLLVRHRELNLRKRRLRDFLRLPSEDEDDPPVVGKLGKRRRGLRDTNDMTAADLRQWACATDVNTLRSMFGTNRNRLWGDLDNTTARRLYHTLLPRVLMGLYAQGLTTPDELAPLAFEARRAAKAYTRERSYVPGRMWATAYDGFRHLKKYGNWSGNGLSWDELWMKYEKQVLGEPQVGLSDLEEDEVDLSTKVYLKILERSCITNSKIDDALLNRKEHVNTDMNGEKGPGEKLVAVASRFEKDVNNMLERNAKFQREDPLSARDFFFLRLLVSTRRRLLMLDEYRKTALSKSLDNEIDVLDNHDMTAIDRILE